MDTRELHDAFAQGNPSLLESLAMEAGYTEKFPILETELMSTRPLKHGLMARDEQSGADREAFYLYFCAPGKKNRKTPKKQFVEISPRTDWNSKYIDHFTLTKQDKKGTRFVDCWAPKDSRANLVLMRGDFYEPFYDASIVAPYKHIDEETKRVLHIAALREHYPPLNLAQILFDLNTPLTIPRMIFRFLFIPATIGNLMQERYLGAAVAACFAIMSELAFGGVRYDNSGNGYYKHKNVRLDRNAIDFLVQER